MNGIMSGAGIKYKRVSKCELAAVVGNRTIAYVLYDPYLSLVKPWIVLLDDTGIYQTRTLRGSKQYIRWHFAFGLL